MTQYNGNYTDEDGRPVQGAAVYVYTSEGATASITDTNDNPVSLPLLTDADGNFAYRAAEGYYQHQVWVGKRRVLIENEVILGKSYRDQAQSAATAAQAALGRDEYPSTALGLAGTALGETFWVDNGNGTATSYRHDAGPVATEIGKFIFDPTDTGAASLTGATAGSVQEGLDAAAEAIASLLDMSMILPVTANAALSIDDLLKHIIIGGSDPIALSLPPANTNGQLLKIFAAYDYANVATIQAATMTTVGGQPAVYLMAGESATFIWVNGAWILEDVVPVPIHAEMFSYNEVPLTTGAWTDVPFPQEGRQLMFADHKALWGYIDDGGDPPVPTWDGFFVAPRPMVITLKANIYLTHTGTGQYFIGAYASPAGGGSPAQYDFVDRDASASVNRSESFAMDYPMNMGDRLNVAIFPVTITDASVVPFATLNSRITIKENPR